MSDRRCSFCLIFLILCVLFQGCYSAQKIRSRQLLSKFRIGLRRVLVGIYKVTGISIIRRIAQQFFRVRVTTDPKTYIPVQFPIHFKLVPWKDVKHYVHFAAATCSKEKQFLKFTCRECKLAGPKVKVLQSVKNASFDTLGYVALDNSRREIIVTFRGTHGGTNIIKSDARFDMIKSPLGDGARLHAGFYVATMSVYKKISLIIKYAIKEFHNYRVIFTGHSLGGAMATQAFYMISAELPRVNYTLVTFGQPRAGDRRFADILNSRGIPSARVVNRRDFVPHGVPRTLGFVHPQTEYWITPGGPRICSNKFYEDPSCSASLHAKTLSGSDHLNYLGSNFGPSCIGENPIDVILQGAFKVFQG